VTTFDAATGGNTFRIGSGQTSVSSAVDANGGNLFQEAAAGPGNAATIGGFVSGVDSISLVNPAGGVYAPITSGSPAPNQVLVSVNGGTSTVSFGDGTTWTFAGVVHASDFYLASPVPPGSS